VQLPQLLPAADEPPLPHGAADATLEEQLRQQLRADRLLAKVQRKERDRGLQQAKQQQQRLPSAGSGPLGWLLGKLPL
jgi:hypothetical protein